MRTREILYYILFHLPSPYYQMATARSYRSSFDESICREAREESPPNKIRRGYESVKAHSSFSSTAPYRRIGSLRRYCTYDNAPYRITTPLGFGPNEFLPLNYQQTLETEKIKKTRKLLDVNKLSDDVLGMCLFSGFLDPSETARLRLVSKRILSIASEQVKVLDLRKCKNLTPFHVESIVESFRNLTVSTFVTQGCSSSKMHASPFTHYNACALT